MHRRPITALTTMVATLAAAAVTAVAVAPTTQAAAPRPVNGSAGVGDPYYPTDGNGGYDVSHYDVAIDYAPTTHHLIGDTRIQATATSYLKSFDLDLLGLRVDGVLVNGRPATWTRSGEHELRVTPRLPLPKGQPFTTRVRYSGVPTDVSQNPDSGWTYSSSGGAFAANEPHSASSWYPLNDTTRDKATFTVRTTVPTGWNVVGNGIERPSRTSAGKTTYTWVESSPIIGYLTTVGIDHWTFLSQTLPDGTPVVSAFAPGADSAIALEKRVPEILGFEAGVFGRYPHDAAGGIHLQDRIGFSLETQTRPVYAQGIDLATVVHEQAHQWYGDETSVHEWKDVCFNECMASYAEDLWSAAKEGVDLDAQYESMVARYRDNVGFWQSPLYDMGAGNEFSAVYYRGPLFLHALRHLVGDRAFFQVLKSYPAQHAYTTTTMKEFQLAFEHATGRDLTAFFDAWLTSTTRPADRFLYPGTLTPATAAVTTLAADAPSSVPGIPAWTGPAVTAAERALVVGAAAPH